MNDASVGFIIHTEGERDIGSGVRGTLLKLCDGQEGVL